MIQMLNNSHNIISRIICLAFVSCTLFGYSADTLAWSADGHTSIGILAIGQLQAESRHELENIIGPLNEQTMAKACNWVYLQSRDCPDQLCATEAVKKYAAELADRQASQEQRWQAFAWLCHLVGDLHQPLHAGFADDRGGNNFDIIFKGEQMNLHGFWDFVLIDQHAGGWQNLVELLSTSPTIQAGSNWSPEMVNDWTNESHKLAEQAAYPASRKIDEIYLQKSWELTQKQISSAASRLALIINSELHNRD